LTKLLWKAFTSPFNFVLSACIGMDSVVFAYIEELDCADLAESRDGAARYLRGDKQLHERHLLGAYSNASALRPANGERGEGEGHVRRREE